MSRTSTAAVIIIGLLVIGGIAYTLSSRETAMVKTDGQAMMGDADTMQKADSMKADAMMNTTTPADTMMKDESSMKGGEAMKDETMMTDDGMKKVQ